MEVTVHWCKWCCLVRWRHESPRSMSCQHLWVHSPALCRAPAWRHPSGFAGVFHATVLGLVVGLSVGGRCVVCVWPLSLSMVCSTRVFDSVGVTGGRGRGPRAGRRSCCWRLLRSCSPLGAGVLAAFWTVARPVRAPCLASPYRLRRSVFRHSLGAGCWV